MEVRPLSGGPSCKIDGCDETDLASRTNLCRKHHNEYTREHYQKNKEGYKARARARKIALAQMVYDIKASTPCADCGETYPHYVMDFDHLDAETKVDNVTSLIRLGGKKRVLDEIAKCEVVCSNCHRERTFKRRQGLL